MSMQAFRPRILLFLTLLAALAGASASRAEQAPRSRALTVTINGTVRLQMLSSKPIKQVINSKEGVLAIRTVVNDPTTLLITGQQADVTIVELTDEDGSKESIEITVPMDIENLKTQLRRAIPTANVTLIPTSNHSVILAGTVTRAEDVDFVLREAKPMKGINIINALRLAPGPQVQLNVTVASISRDCPLALGCDFLPCVPSGQLQSSATVRFAVLNKPLGFLDYLETLRVKGRARLLTQPTLITASGQPCSFLIYDIQPVPIPPGPGSVALQFDVIRLRVNLLPIVLGDGKIHLQVEEPQISELDAAGGVVISGATVPGPSTDCINISEQLESGQSFVIRRPTRRQSSFTSTHKTSILGDLPILGDFFTHNTTKFTEEELLLLVTPHVFDPSR